MSDPGGREWDGRGSLVAFVVSLNLRRRHLDASQRAVIAAEVESALAEEARGRQREGGRKAGRGRPRKVPTILSEPIPAANGEAREQAARLVGVSPSYVSDAKRILREAPGLAGRVKAGTPAVP